MTSMRSTEYSSANNTLFCFDSFVCHIPLGIIYEMTAIDQGETEDTFSTYTTNTLTGALISIGGSILVCIGLLVQKYAHNARMAHVRANPDDPQKHYLKSKKWWIGFIINILGELANFSAFAFAPASVVTMLNATSILLNSMLAPIFLDEPFLRRHAIGNLLAIVGAVLIIIFTTTEQPVLTMDRLSEIIGSVGVIVFTGVTLVILVVLIIAAKKYGYGKKYVFVNVLITSLFGGLTVVSTKAISSLLGTFQASYLENPIFYVMVVIMAVTIVFQVKFLNSALRHFESTVVLPTQFVLFNLCSIASSAVVYDDFSGMSIEAGVVFFVGCILVCTGVMIISGHYKLCRNDSILLPNNTSNSMRRDDENSNGSSHSNAPEKTMYSKFEHSTLSTLALMQELALEKNLEAEKENQQCAHHDSTPPCDIQLEPVQANILIIQEKPEESHIAIPEFGVDEAYIENVQIDDQDPLILR